MTELRANLREWLAHSRRGEEVVITERGVPVARLVGVDTVDVIERLTREGVLGKPMSSRKRRAAGRRRARPAQPVSGLIGELRR